jgi:peptidyl-prolyl cis-trans isomerase C
MIGSSKSTYKGRERDMDQSFFARAAAAAMVLGLFAGAAPSAAAVEVAKVNGKAITDKDVTAALSGMNEGQRKSFLQDPNSRRQVVMGLVDQEVVYQEAEKAKLDQDAAYKQAMEQFRRQYLVSTLLDRNVGGQVNEKTAKGYYNTHKSRFSTDKARVWHILLNDEPTAREVAKRASASGADFQAIAEKESRDPSAKNNRGELGVITRDGPFADEFKDAVFAAEVDKVSGPVKTLYGYHVIKVVEKSTGRPMEYDEVELRVKAAYRAELTKQYVGKLKQQAKVSVDDKAIDKL